MSQSRNEREKPELSSLLACLPEQVFGRISCCITTSIASKGESQAKDSGCW